ncbi:leucine--tRNA ligase [candidate division WWE3 bacterium CG_4_10_14_0_2_um_filter_41_14]|uniref:Leucine--tRNA ligase n=1 Tax=candidate division WWE3 bacterium CG_4_10_14_0_2_um_filter_41_14 TaxID=1975072 RepID=A0A2M7THC2_UNCKA|nr:MAG: leucine--tRNA ligase [candidate division WWE3 bacterium CG_4_10_14_0_2_um_filter_41_14]
MSENAYNSKKIEPKWREFWKKLPIYQADLSSDNEKEYILVEFPYPSGAGLHVGHVWGYTMGDVLARRARMKGKNVLFPMGWDAFGLPTENYAIKTGVHPAVATAQNVATFRQQMDRMGFSFDWSREINTTDPNYYKWTQWIFLKLFEKGLAYKSNMPINWCAFCKTGLANEEVTGENLHERCGKPVERRMIDQWLLKITAYADRLIDDLSTVDYTNDIVSQQTNWIGRSIGAYVTFAIEGSSETVTVFTTRADTLPGVTFMVVSPEHPLLSTLTTDEQSENVRDYVKIAASKSELERSQLQKDKTGVFTGSYVINPLTGARVPLWVSDYVLASYGTGAVMGVPAYDERDAEFAEKYHIPVVEVEELGEHVSEEIVQKLAEKGSAKPGVEYKLRDWIFSRQHYWGEPIPIIHCETCGMVPVPIEQLPLELPEITDYQPTEDGRSPLAKVESWVNVVCPTCGKMAKRETDTMPNWAGSSWYFLRFVDPHNNSEFASREKLDHMMPVDLYIGGAEHTTLHLLYSRFWHKVLFDQGLVATAEPYAKRRNRGIILAPDGRKMSKSLGNVINPNDEVDVVGADTLRMYELFMGPYQDTFPWNPSAEKGVYRFLERVYAMQGKVLVNNLPDTRLSVRIKLNETIRKVGKDVENMKFNTAISALMECLNEIERTNGAIAKKDWQDFVKLLAPFAPFISEQLWFEMSEELGKPFISIHVQAWPSEDNTVEDKKDIVIPIQVNGKHRDTLIISDGDVRQETVESRAKEMGGVKKWLDGKAVSTVVYVPGRLINFVLQK